MESITTQQQNSLNNNKTAKFEAPRANINEAEKHEELSCNQLLKNLLKTNLKLLKINDISTILLF